MRGATTSEWWSSISVAARYPLLAPALMVVQLFGPNAASLKVIAQALWAALDTVDEDAPADVISTEPLALPGELELDDPESLPLPEDDGPIVPRAN